MTSAEHNIVANMRQMFKAKFGRDCLLASDAIMEIRRGCYGMELDCDCTEDDVAVEMMKEEEDERRI